MTDPRHRRRQQLLQAIFASTFTPERQSAAKAVQKSPLLKALLAKLPDIDAVLTQAAPERPLTEINKVDLAILRLIVFEYQTERTPKRVLINEAVELAKEFGSDSSARFVNGVLGEVIFDAEPVTEK